MSRESQARRILGGAAVLAAAAAVLLSCFARERGPRAETLMDAWAREDGPRRMELLVTLVAQPQETERALEERLHGDDAAAQYDAARLATDLGGTLARSALLERALDPGTPDACRAGAMYALRGPALSQREKTAILQTAVETGRPIVGRAALAALSGNASGEDARALESLLDHGDALTRVYAARLLDELGRGPGAAFYREVLEHRDYLVRQESYDALGRNEDPAAGTLLEKALARETNLSAARAARLAFGFHRAGAADPGRDRFFEEILENGDDDERLWALDTLKDLDPAREESSLKTLAAEASEFGLLCRTRLALDTKAAAPPVTESKHHTVVHNLLAVQALEQFHAQSGAPRLNPVDSLRLAEALVSEDSGTNPLRHADNPLTGRGFFGYGTFGGPASQYMDELLEALDSAVGSGEIATAIELAGRLLHLVQDMTSPLHVFCVSHPFNTCLFEDYWRSNMQEVQALLERHEIVAARPGAMPPGVAERLDSFSAGRLEARLAALPGGLPGHFEAMAWLTYFTASHWGELRYADEASASDTLAAAFRDGNAGTSPNVLHAMFDGKIRYHTSWWRDYFEIEDRFGNTYSWNKCFVLDGFRPCSNPASGTSLEGHVRDRVSMPDGDVLRVTGRFYFTQRGFRVPHCHPVRFADGMPTDMHLTRYYGEALFPLAVAHSIGWLNELAARAPDLFERPVDVLPTQDAAKADANAVWHREDTGEVGFHGRGMQTTEGERYGQEENNSTFRSILDAESTDLERAMKELQSALGGCFNPR